MLWLFALMHDASYSFCNVFENVFIVLLIFLRMLRECGNIVHELYKKTKLWYQKKKICSQTRARERRGKERETIK